MFSPKFDVGRLDVTKIVINGQLVEVEAGEGHVENVPPPVEKVNIFNLKNMIFFVLVL